MKPPAPPLPLTFVLLDNRVKYHQYSHWRMVEHECDSRVAYGCGPLGQRIVEGVTLVADLHGGDDGAPRLAVHVLDEVLHRLEEEVDPGDLARIYGGRDDADRIMERHGTRVVPCGGIEAVDDEGGVLVLRLSFVHHSERIDLRSYHVVYDRDAASLSLLLYEPTDCRAVYTSCPLLMRRHDGGGGYSLVLTAVDHSTGDAPGRPVVCLWTPSFHDNDGLGPWRIRQRRHATAMPLPDGFDATHAFTYKGKAFWADLTQGILHCECADILLNDDAGVVEFTFVALPEEYLIEEVEYRHRVMGVGVGDNVWFVTLKSCEHPGDTTVVVLSLNLSLSDDMRRWESHMELSLLSIWALEGFADAGLPRRVPRAPFLREQDAGVIYLFLPPADEKAERGCHLIGVDVRDRSEPRLLPPRRLATVPFISDQPELLSPEFFDRPRTHNHEGGALSQPSSAQP